MAVTVILSFKAQPGKREALVDFLKAVQPSAIENGCHSIAVHRDLGNEDGVFEVEYWDNKEIHESWVNAAAEAGAFAPFDEMLAEPFAVHYCEPVQKTDA